MLSAYYREKVTKLGVTLINDNLIHHRDRDPTNNKNENLIVCENKGYHRLIHAREDAYRATGDVNSRKCKVCKEWDSPSNMKRKARYRYGEATDESPSFVHKKCHAKYELKRRKKSWNSTMDETTAMKSQQIS